MHADRRESDLTPIPKETLDLWGATGGAPTARRGGRGDAERRPSEAVEFGPYMLLLLLVVAVAESIVADRYLRPSAAQVDSVVKKEAA